MEAAVPIGAMGTPQHSSAGENEPLTQPEPAFDFDQCIAG
jgi:hypothetical protein